VGACPNGGPMSNAVSDFLIYCRVERRLADLTCKAYERDVRACIDFLRTQGIAALVEVRTSDCGGSWPMRRRTARRRRARRGPSPRCAASFASASRASTCSATPHTSCATQEARSAARRARPCRASRLLEVPGARAYGSAYTPVSQSATACCWRCSPTPACALGAARPRLRRRRPSTGA